MLVSPEHEHPGTKTSAWTQLSQGATLCIWSGGGEAHTLKDKHTLKAKPSAKVSQ